MELNEKIEKIMSGLTGDNEKDTAYLREQTEIYKNDENAQEILRAIGRKLYQLLPDEKKNEIIKQVGNTKERIEMTIEEAMYQLTSNNDSVKAENMLASVIKELEGMFTDDKVSEYRCFENIIE